MSQDLKPAVIPPTDSGRASFAEEETLSPAQLHQLTSEKADSPTIAPYSLPWVLRAVVLGLFLALNAVLINISQFVAYSLRPLDSLLFRRWCQHTERYFTLVLIHLTQWLAPTTLVLTHDTSIPATGPDALVASANATASPTAADQRPCAVLDGTVARLNLAPRAIVIANHQVYMDWIYLWFVAYYAGCHGYVKIILKDSLRSIPIFGWGMQFFRFIFLRRNWEADRRSFTEQIRETAQDALPYWLTLFPEGTTISQKALNKSSAFGIAQGYAATQHVLLPRSTGLFHVCQGLRESSDYLYDITMGCEGLRADQVPQETYTIPRMFLERFYPRLIHIHVRRVPMGDVPTESEAFAQWLQQRWYEKDRLMAYFYRCGHFPHLTALADLPPPLSGANTDRPKGMVAAAEPCVTISVKARSWWELGQLWVMLVVLIYALRVGIGALSGLC